MTVRIEHGHVIDRLRAMPAESVQCVITSVPYYGLRSYKTEPQIFGGNERCAHEFADVDGRLGGGKHTSAKARWQHDAKNRPHGHAKTPQSAFCEWCGAWRGEHGLEPTVDLWLAHEVLIWREIRRVLRKDGCAWLNVGDSYAGGGRGADTNSTLEGSRDSQQESRVAVRSRGSQANAGLHERARSAGALNRAWTPPPQGFKAKQRLMLPSRLALALQDDGWWIRDEIVWHKPNPMPSSVDDRTTPAHEMIYLLSKRARYFFDAAAISEPFSEASITRLTQANIPQQMGGVRQDQFDIEGYNNHSRRPNEIVAALSQKISRVPSGWDPDNHDTIAHSERESQNGTRRIDGDARSEGEPYASNPPSRRNSFARETKASAGEHGQRPQHRPDREPISYGASGNKERTFRRDDHYGSSIPWEGVTRNKRSVWTIPTEPFAEAHFATFPTKLVEPMILAGTSAKGACVACGAPWARVKKADGWKPTCKCTEWRCPNGCVVPYSADEEIGTRHGVSDVRRTIQSVEDGRALLQPEMLREPTGTTAPDSMRPVQDSIPAKSVSAENVQQDLRAAMEREEPEGRERLHHHGEGLSIHSRPRPPECDEGRLCDGAPLSNGEEAKAALAADRGCSPSQREKIGQPAAQPASHGEARTRRRKASGLLGDVSTMQRALPDERKCARCGSVLKSSAPATRPCIVLDCFLGSGTTALVAERLRRDTIGIELNGDYVQMAMRRLRDDCSLFTRIETAAGPSQGIELAEENGARHANHTQSETTIATEPTAASIPGDASVSEQIALVTLARTWDGKRRRARSTAPMSKFKRLAIVTS